MPGLMTPTAIAGPSRPPRYQQPEPQIQPLLQLQPHDHAMSSASYFHDPTTNSATATTTAFTTHAPTHDMAMYMVPPAPGSEATASSMSMASSSSSGQTHTPGLGGGAPSIISSTRSSRSSRTIQAHHQPPVPPARTSSLPAPPSPATAKDLAMPFVQVTHATPKKKGHKRGAAGVESPASQGSPSSKSAAALPGKAANTLRVKVDDEEMDEDSEREREMSVEDKAAAVKLAKTRQMGRDRQRRKRERDKKARDALKAAGLPTVVAKPLTTAVHLPIPQPNASNSSLPLAISVPSPSSSQYSQLPMNHSFYQLSPGLFNSTLSMSGQSSPNVAFSPSLSTPGLGYCDTSYMWTPDISEPSRPASRGGRKPRASSSSTSISMMTSVSGIRRPSVNAPALAPPIEPKKNGPSPSKRRKSELDLEDFRPKEVAGLGMDIGPSQRAVTADRPKARRTTSDSAAIAQNHRPESRSPTPPPVPDLPAKYRHPVSSKGMFFASNVVFALSKGQNEHVSSTLHQQLGIGEDELKTMQEDLAAMFDRWVMERDMGHVSLDSNNGDVMEGVETMQPQQSQLTQDASFFTPASRPSSRRALGPSASASAAIAYAQPYGAPQESPLAQQASSNQHTRHRSLSSASLMARGLKIVPSNPANVRPPPQPVWSSASSSLENLSSEQSTSPAGELVTPSGPSVSASWHSSATGEGWHTAKTSADQTTPVLDSPLAMTAGAMAAVMGGKNIQMAPPPLNFGHPQAIHGMQPISGNPTDPFSATSATFGTPSRGLRHTQSQTFPPQTPIGRGPISHTGVGSIYFTPQSGPGPGTYMTHGTPIYMNPHSQAQQQQQATIQMTPTSLTGHMAHSTPVRQGSGSASAGDMMLHTPAQQVQLDYYSSFEQ